MASRPVTAADVAERAGVSRATVSHILNGREGQFAPGTRSRVLEAAAALDYRPSPAGRSLVRGRGDTIVMLVPQSTIGQNQQDALDRLTADTRPLGANVVLRFSDADAATTATAVLRLAPLAVVDFGVLPAEQRQRLAAQGVPTVPRLEEPEGVHDDPLDQRIAELQVDELTRTGPRAIVYGALRDRRPDPLSPLRFEAIRQVCERRSLSPPRFVEIPLHSDEAFQALSPLLGHGPVGLAAYNDVVGLAAISVGLRLGLRIPGELSVIGLDASDFGQLVHPRMTTIDVNMDRFIDRAVAQLADDLGVPLPPTDDAGSNDLVLVRGEST